MLVKTKRVSSILAFQSLFAWDMQKQAGLKAQIKDILKFEWVSEEKLARFKKERQDALEFARLTVLGTVEHIEEVDEVIKQKLKNWDFSRLTATDKALLRMSVYLMLHQKDIPAAITISEAIGVSAEYSKQDSFKFINGILEAVRKDVFGDSPPQ